MKTILFDLDGTLLPMNEDDFVKGYFGKLYKFMAPYGYEKDSFIDAVWYGTKAMRLNDGKRICEDVYWDAFISKFEGKDKNFAHQKFNEFYATVFNETKQYCFEPYRKIDEVIKACREYADKLIVVANPVFPLIAMQERIVFAGIDPSIFDFITSYETSHFAKPNKMFIKEVMDRFNLDTKDVIYFGNSEKEDGRVAKELDIEFYLTGNVVKEENSLDGYKEIEFESIPILLQQKLAKN